VGEGKVGVKKRKKEDAERKRQANPLGQGKGSIKAKIGAGNRCWVRTSLKSGEGESPHICATKRRERK